jgi:phosphoribosylformylglycinamidine synthase subunit PurQ / glutaminase
MTDIKVLILSGDGINCENETAMAFREAGANPTIVHISELLERPKDLLDYSVLALPGGFSFGDELGSGLVMANKMNHYLKDELKQFVEEKRPIIGICNGFQVLVKLGLLLNPSETKEVSLDTNTSGKFLNKWAELKTVENNCCLWAKKLAGKTFALPVRHGEGRVVLKSSRSETNNDLYDDLLKNGQVVFQYKEDINGSDYLIAGLTNRDGNILGLMPHPEAYLFEGLSPLVFPKKMDKKAEGLEIFESIIEHLKG